MANSLISRLQRFFGLTVKTTKSGVDKKQILPVDRRDPNMRALKMPSELKKIWDWWLNENHDTLETLKNRADRIKDLEYMRFNDGIISMSAELYADESVQADSQNEILKVTAKDRKVESAIYDLFDKWGWDQSKIRAVCDDIAFYGEGFTIDGIDEKLGVVSMTHTDVKIFKSRMEFRAAEARTEQNERMTNWNSLLSKNLIMRQLLDTMEQSNIDYSQYFEPFLFGFGLDNEIFLPPWAVSHFRLKTSVREFFPWGKSLFIYCVALFRQLSASKNLMGVARLASLPREKFAVKTDDNMSQAEQWMAIEEAKEEYANISSQMRSKEEFTVASEVWLPKELLDYEVVGGNATLNDIKDIELLRDDMIIATGVPKGYLVVDRASFGTSGQSLLQQYKPFGRRVFSVQGAFLSELAAKIRLHFMITNQFEGEFTEFSLSMNFPVIEEARDRMSAKGDSFRLATEIVNGVKDIAGIQGDLPIEIVKDIFSHLSFLSSDEIESWIDGAYKKAEKDKSDSEMLEQKKSQWKEADLAKMKSRISEDVVRGVAFDSLKRRKFKEGVMGRRHYINSSTNISLSEKFLYDGYRNFGKEWLSISNVKVKRKVD